MSDVIKGPAEASGESGRASQQEKNRQFVWEVRKAGGEPSPTIDFNTFVISLASSAMYHMDKGPLPDGKQGGFNLPLAHQTIDVLTLLQDKTRGNLSSEEDELLTSVLYDLRVTYVSSLRKEEARSS